MARTVEIVIPYEPRIHQAQLHGLVDTNRFVVCVAHRRFGKTVAAINECIRQAVQCSRDRARVIYLAPQLKQAKAVAWDYLLHYSDGIPGREVNIAELRVDLPNGARIQLAGADNPDALRGIYIDFVVLDEVAQMPARAWSEVIRPALADREGRALFIGTPNGRNLFQELRNRAADGLAGWGLLEFRASDTHILAESELQAAKDVMTSDEYRQEFEASFEASVRGSIYGAELQIAREEGRITRVPADPALPVDTWWDIGVGDATAIWWVQRLNSEIRVIDYYEASGEGLPHYLGVLKSKRHTYGLHIGPHDLAVREFGTGRSRLETARDLGMHFTVCKALRLEDGIHAVRMALPRMYFDAERCRPGLEALQNYRWERNERLGEFRATPLHDWASHAADSMRYGALMLQSGKLESKPIEYPKHGFV